MAMLELCPVCSRLVPFHLENGCIVLDSHLRDCDAHEVVVCLGSSVKKTLEGSNVRKA